MITEKELTKKDFLEELKLLAQDIISEDRFREAYDLSKILSSSIDVIKGFKDRNHDLYLEYKDIINELRWVGLPIMTEEGVINMFQFHFTVIFKLPDYDLWEKLRVNLLKIIILDDRDKFKKQLRDALLKNEEKITSQRLIIDDQKKDSTISNWLVDYNRTLGTGGASGLARTEYLVNGKNIRNLNDEEKKKIKILFNLYERLKLSSQTFEGLENEIPLDEDGAVGIIKEGVFEPLKETDKQKQTWQMIEDFLKKHREQGTVGEKAGVKAVNQAENNLTELKQLAAKYPPGSFERKTVEEEIEKREKF